MNLKELQKLVSDNIDAKLVYPFSGGKVKQKIIYHIYQNEDNNKMIVAVFERDNKLLINIKLTPEHVDESINIRGIERGFHMNKKHWVTVDVNDTDLSIQELINMMKESESLIANN